MDFTPSNPRGSLSFGIALDIGTTTIAAYLVDLDSKRRDDAVIASASQLNGQRVFGADEFARIEYSKRTDRGSEELARLVRTDVRVLADRLLSGAGAGRDTLQAMAVVGSATMLRLFLGRRPVGNPKEEFGLEGAAAADFDLPYPVCQLIVPPPVSGALDAGFLAAIKAAGLADLEEPTLLIDLGSKGAVALGDRRGIVCCEVAAGPPFEGPSITCGTGGTAGAVDRVFWEDGRLRWTTIGSADAVGLCASGVLDATACLVRASLVDSSGALDERWWASGYPLVRSDTADLRFTQADLRQVQLSKASVAACIGLVMAERGISPADVDRTLLSGSFGGELSPASAAVVGLLPPNLLERSSWIGNASGLGAVRLLLHDDEYERMKALALRSKVLDPSTTSGFDELFGRELLFPAPDSVLEAVVPAVV